MANKTKARIRASQARATASPAVKAEPLPRRQGAPQAAGAQLNVLGQYIKDLSFESPAAPKRCKTRRQIRSCK